MTTTTTTTNTASLTTAPTTTIYKCFLNTVPRTAQARRGFVLDKQMISF